MSNQSQRLGRMGLRPSAPALTGTLDCLSAIGLLVGVVLWVAWPHLPPGGVAHFLIIRITLLNASFSVVFAMAWKQCLSALGLYRKDHKGLAGLMMRIALACGAMTLLLGMYLEARHAGGPIDLIMATFMASAFLFESCRSWLSNPEVRWRSGQPEQVIILGSGRRASKAWRELRLRHHRSKRLVGFVDDRDPAAMPPDMASRLIGKVDELPGYLLRHEVDELIVATPMRSCYDMTQRAVSIAEAAGIRVVCLSDTFTLAPETHRRRQGSLFVELAAKDRGWESAAMVKRVVDIVGAALGMVLLAPVFVAISVAIKLTTSGSIFQVQERHGFGRRRFRMVKFRSMARNAAEQRVTPVGRFLRRTLLDQLPELWNVLSGDMSLVGPRPLSVEDVSNFREPRLMRRFRVRPGITGNWQLVERSSLSLEQRAALDFSYVDQWSLGMDLKILARTIPAILKRSSALQ